MNLSDAELVVMNILWDNVQLRATQVADIAAIDKGWSKNTTYTLIKRLIKKEAVLREDPGFVCTPLVKKEEVQLEETKSLIDKLYKGSFSKLVRNFVKEENLTDDEIKELRDIISEVESED